MGKHTAALVEQYDRAIFDPALRTAYAGTDFFNIGDWSDGPHGRPRDLGEAAARLVARHIAADTDETTEKASLVLDVGCGLGAGAAMLALFYSRDLVLGVNVSTAQALHAAAAVRAARFAVMDAAHLAIASDSVDRMHCIEAAFHFDSRSEFLAEAYRVLRRGGKAFLTDMSFRYGYGETIPSENIELGQSEYRTRCERAGFSVETLTDITDSTLVPYCEYLRSQGRAAEAALHRRRVRSYFFAVMRKP
jgi:cyclopropane fatty-acyl-phospholipid synthase-like methyltransferase